ncbi:MAG: DUF3237 family protein [Pseudohongiellaceae bacterium]
MQPKDPVLTDIPQSLTSGRREVLQGGLMIAGGFIVGNVLAAEAPALVPPTYNPAVEPAFTIFATIEGVLEVGATATGQVRAIPITGGEIVGQGIAGRVIPGGADWQRTRSDGVTEIEATYAIELSDSTLLKVVNRGLIVRAMEEGVPGYFRTAIEFTAPTGPWQWLNQSIFLCSAGGAEGRPGTVQVDVYKLV